MRQIPAAKFKEQCLSLIITKRGKPIAWLIPAWEACAG
jgi:hypothetical protein